MKNSKTLELIVGLFVVFGILGLSFLAYKVSQVNKVGKEGYILYADFESISGLKNNAPVTMAGVKIGKVQSIKLSDNYKARITMIIDNDFDNLPLDTSASVLTSGLLGEKYLGLDAGADDEYLSSGDEFEFTKSSIVIERLIDKFLYNMTKK